MNIYAMKKPKKVNAVSITITILALIIGYACWFLVPAFWPIFQLTGMMRGACNDAYREHDDTKVLNRLLKDASRTGLRLSKDNFRLTRLPYSEDELANMEDRRRTMLTKRGKACLMEMHYEADYTWPLVGSTTHLVFDRQVEVDLAQVTWEKQCTCVTVPTARE